MAFQLDIAVPSSKAPWAGATGDGDIAIEGVDWSGGAFVMTFKYLVTDTSNAILLANATAGTEGVSATYNSAYVSARTGAVVGATIIRPQINEATLTGLTWAALVSLALQYDLLVTPTGLPQQVICFGTMTIRKGIGT